MMTRKSGALCLWCLFFISITYSFAVVPASSSANEIIRLLKKRSHSNSGAALYPQATDTRDLRVLDGIWNFRLSPPNPEYGYNKQWFEKDLSLVSRWLGLLIQPDEKPQEHPGYTEKWFQRDLKESGPVQPMPVPASYNDLDEDRALRDHVGLVWYDRRFHVPAWWKASGQRVWLRFCSVHYAAQVWINGKAVQYHEIGHLPFETEITDALGNNSNLLTVAVDNTLLSDTIPQGEISIDPEEYDYDWKDKTGTSYRKMEQSYTFDFFNYAGIHRSVFLYSTPRIYIDDVVVNTDAQGRTGFIVYNITYKGDDFNDIVQCQIQLFDKLEQIQVGGSTDCAGLIEVVNANFWWPYLMHDDPGYLYVMKVNLIGNRGQVLDTYNQKVGIRTVTWSNTTMYINEKPIYFRGFGMHEDSDLRGKGWDPVLWVKNFNLLKWVGANAFRTSHYPYAEEIYQLADEMGIMIVDECPSVDTDLFTDVLLEKHKQSLTELIRRDKNHPSVIMWSISNEPRTFQAASDSYFGEVVKHVKSMDLSRPVSLAMAQNIDRDKAAKHLDIIMFNRYNAWYNWPGQLDKIVPNVVGEAKAWHNRYNKPVLMSEYGADTVPGLHLMPEYVWSEEYQVAYFAEHFKAFDFLRKTGFWIGEFIWNFADFKTAQTTTRVGGNKKGIFTRSRQPKTAAHLVRLRYHQLAAADDGASLPDNLTPYSSNNMKTHHEEL